jgi:hypothetical protein
VIGELKRTWKLSWPNLRYYPGVCLEGLKKSTRNLSQDSRSESGTSRIRSRSVNDSTTALLIFLYFSSLHRKVFLLPNTDLSFHRARNMTSYWLHLNRTCTVCQSLVFILKTSQRVVLHGNLQATWLDITASPCVAFWSRLLISNINSYKERNKKLGIRDQEGRHFCGTCNWVPSWISSAVRASPTGADQELLRYCKFRLERRGLRGPGQSFEWLFVKTDTRIVLWPTIHRSCIPGTGTRRHLNVNLDAPLAY